MNIKLMKNGCKLYGGIGLLTLNIHLETNELDY